MPESGLVAVIVAGSAVGNTRTHELVELREFKEQLTVLLVATIFVLLSANVHLSEVFALGWRGALTVLALIVVVRPVDVLVSTSGSELGRRERLFLAWLAPRGIVAAAVATLFAERMDEAGVGGGTSMRALVFFVIATTVIVRGMSAGLVARLLGVQLPRDRGYVILGADAIARELGDALRAAGEEVIFIDANAGAARAAEEAGFKVVFGDGLEERALVKARADTRRACIGATPNESVNFPILEPGPEVRPSRGHLRRDRRERPRRLRKDGRSAPRACALRRRQGALHVGRGCRKDTARPPEMARNGRRVFARRRAGHDLSPLAVVRAGVARPGPRAYRAKAGDVVDLLVARPDDADLWLHARGWQRQSPP